MKRVDTGSDPGASKAIVIGPTRYVVKEEATFHLAAMGQATSYFAVGTGDYARIFPAADFRKATEPVLRACGDHW